MSGLITQCRTCGLSFEPDRTAIRRGTWRTCPPCRTASAPPDDHQSRCQRCGRPLRGGRTLCAQCLGLPVA